MKILVLGGTGMAGHTIAIYLKEQGHDVTTYSRKKFKYCDSIVGDVRNFLHLEEVIRKGKYDGIINAVGILNQDAEDDKATAILLNAYLPNFLSDITKNTKAKVIQMSTDCVFSGKRGGYKEDSFKDGKSFYDKSKGLGELDNGKDLTFRNSIVGPDMKEKGIGLFNWFMNQTDNVNGFTNSIWTGVTTLTLARAIEKALEENLTGLYNLVNNEKINKYELLLLFNKYARDNTVNISPIDGIRLDKSLVNTRRDFSFIVPSYEEMIKEMVFWIEQHQELYPHYNKNRIE